MSAHPAKYAVIVAKGKARLDTGKVVKIANPDGLGEGDQGMAENLDGKWVFSLFEAAEPPVQEKPQRSAPKPAERPTAPLTPPDTKLSPRELALKILDGRSRRDLLEQHDELGLKLHYVVEQLSDPQRDFDIGLMQTLQKDLIRQYQRAHHDVSI